MQLGTVLIVTVPRLLAPQTGRTEMAVVPWAAKSARWTALFEAWAVRLLQGVPNVSRAAELLRLDWHSAWELKARAVARGLERLQDEPIATLGLDEKSFRRGQDYATAQAVSIDMWPAFAAAIPAQLPQARIVYDPFHVVSHTNAAVDAVRRAKHRQRQPTGDETL
jgi:transposase